MRVFFENIIQNKISEICPRHRNYFRRADPHFDVGEYVRGEAERRERAAAAPPGDPAPQGGLNGDLSEQSPVIAGACVSSSGGVVRLAGLPPGLAAGSPPRGLWRHR